MNTASSHAAAQDHTDPDRMLRSTVYVVDDDVELGKAVGRLLRALNYEVEVFPSAIQFLLAYDPTRAGCILLDHSMPSLDGRDVQTFLAVSGYTTPIVFLSGVGTISATVDAMKAGAVDCLTKPVDMDILMRAVEQALRADARRRRTEMQRQRHIQCLARLTPRERQVLAALVKGRLNKQIAGELGTVEKTIKVHRARVMAKMEVNSLAELVQRAECFGLGLESAGAAAADIGGWRSHKLAEWSWDIRNDLVTAHPALVSLFGIEESRVPPLPLARYLAAIHPDDVDRVGRLIRASITSGAAYEAIYRVQPRGEDWRIVLARGRVEFDSDGSPIRLPGALIDITEACSAGSVCRRA